MKLETSPKVTKSKRSLHWCRSISKKNICAGFITVSVKKLLHYRAGGLLQYRAFYYIIGQLLDYRAFFITLSGSYYSIERLLHYRLVQVCLRLREQCLRSKITSVARVAHVLLLRFVAGNVGMNTPASKRSQLIGNIAIVRKRRVIHTKSICV